MIETKVERVMLVSEHVYDLSALTADGNKLHNALLVVSAFMYQSM